MRKFKTVVIGVLLLLNSIQCQEVIIPKPPPAEDLGNPTEPGGINPIPVDGDYADCLYVLSDTTLDVVSWNIEQFSASNTNTERLAELIQTIDADIIGVQEITSISDFNTMLATIPGWEGSFINQSGLSTGYVYKTAEITLNGAITTIYDDEDSAFPRAPLLGTFTHNSGLVFTAINLHLKCCGGAENEQRRRNASTLIKSYIDTNLPSDKVIVLGDYNDEIQESSVTNVFQNLIDDSDNYQFTDMNIAQGSTGDFSYPSWPSHLDHILITNELFDQWQSTSTLKIDDCYGSYEVNISDHRPVMTRFTVN